MAKTVAKSSWHLHTVSWIHKGVRSKNIVFLTKLDTTVDFDTPHLIGLEYSRHNDDATSYAAVDEDPEKNLYRHLEWQGPPSTRFKKSHDLYSLGLVLLEIGVWKTLGNIVQTHMPLTDDTPEGRMIL
ncbi:hypothetical protein K469DRAFT_566510 [Zopfia rhizophila CBS 207.26]|uniref:Protein kinase domain-containing protein n=1 Tax=Zopfia rhizophila CBS 207.26 TaxID=1314779 RepID=A0A6A6EC02_9PEZI|nr:hypothetical protein K469DRAFT_566510 [Zopfia rhizophila CBS 207.26]